ncbi:MBG domain-containing protein, partial [Hufsiella ginkgonis]
KSITVTASAKTKVYGSADPSFTYVVTGLVGSEKVTGDLSRAAGEDIGNHAINQGSLNGGGNYQVVFVGADLSVTPRTVAVKAEAKAKIYGDADPTLTYTTPAGGPVNGDKFTGSLTRDNGEPVGRYTIRQGDLSLSSNYLIVFTGAELTIGKRAIAVTAEAKTKVYGDPAPPFTYMISNGSLVKGDSFTGSLSRNPGSNTGNYGISQGNFAINGNYILSFTGASLVIGKRPLTITAENKTRPFGAFEPAFTAMYSGFATGETNLVLSKQPVLSTTASLFSLEGSYPINIGDAAAANYEITYVNGTLTILPATDAPITLTQLSFFENQPAGTVVATIAPLVNRPGESFAYSLAQGAGGEDNGAFSIAGNQLKISRSLDFEQQQTYKVLVRSTDKNGVPLVRAFTLSLVDVNEAPTLAAVPDQSVCPVTTVQKIALSGISGGPESGQTTSVTIAASVPAMFTQLSVASGIISYALAAGASGKAVITVKVTDNGGTANGGTDTFLRDINVLIYTPPVISIIYSTPTATVSKGATITLTASGGATYQWANAAGVTGPQNMASLTVTPAATTTYTVTATSATGCTSQQSITITTEDIKELNAVNLMTPNGDGVNDKWVIKDIALFPNNWVKVFDRAGRLVFSKAGYENDWDATFNGSPLAPGTYYYVVNLGPVGGTYKGFITILSKKWVK